MQSAPPEEGGKSTEEELHYLTLPQEEPITDSGEIIHPDTHILPPMRIMIQRATNSIKQNKMKWKNAGVAILLMIANYYYILSLESCPYHSERECLLYLQDKYSYLIKDILFSVILFVIPLVLLHLGKISKIYIIVIIINMGFLCFVYDTGSDFQNHGMFNVIIFLVLLGLVLGFVFFVIFYIKGLLKHPRITLILSVLFFLFLLIIYKSKIENSCKGWENGLGDTKLDQSPKYCKIGMPETCFFNIMGDWTDLSYWFDHDCKKPELKESKLLPYLPFKNTTFVGFPRTEHDPPLDRDMSDDPSRLQMHILERLIDLNNTNATQEEIDNLEVIIDFTDRKDPILNIDVKYNKTAAQEAKKRAANRTTEPITKNFLFIFIDSLSRADVYRKMPKTVKFFNNYFRTQQETAEAFQFFRFHTMNTYTFDNMIPMMYGTHSKKDYGPDAEHMLYTFRRQGFVVGMSRNSCSGYDFNYVKKETPNLKFGEYDNEDYAMFCDPTFAEVGVHYSNFRGQNSVIRRCMYGHDTCDHVIEYGKQFWTKYSEESKFLQLSFGELHEATGQGVRYVDDGLAEFLENLEEKEDTTIVLLGDHGLSLTFVFCAFCDDVAKERVLPTLFFLIPKKALKKNPEIEENLRNNENILVGNYGVHQTFLEISGSDKQTYISTRAQEYNNIRSLFKEIPTNRTCDDIHVLSKSKCSCRYP